MAGKAKRSGAVRSKAKRGTRAPKQKKYGQIVGRIPGAGAGSDGRTLDGLHKVVLSRRGADPEKSHTARMFQRGPAKIAQKMGEEAVEAVIEGARENPKALVLESADVLYHMLVLWAALGVKPAQVWKELKRREVRSGVAEKAARKPERAKKAKTKGKSKRAR